MCLDLFSLNTPRIAWIISRTVFLDHILKLVFESSGDLGELLLSPVHLHAGGILWLSATRTKKSAQYCMT